MRLLTLFTALALTLLFSMAAHSLPNIEKVDLKSFQWAHGSATCKEQSASTTLAPLQIVRIDKSSFVLRQNKCLTFEAPFIYLLIGSDRALVVDTGAVGEINNMPLYETIRNLIADSEKPLLVVHSHSHGDHRRGDAQFRGQPNVELVEPDMQSVIKQLGFQRWPNKEAELDLGKRKLALIPIPGHQSESIAIYDKQTGVLLTGDSLYPGLIRVKDWTTFKHSIMRLAQFAESHTISMILGGHIEMNAKTRQPYAIGEQYQPHEPPLPLQVHHLSQLNSELQQTDGAAELVLDEFVISPLSWFEKFLSRVLSGLKNLLE